MTEPKQPEALRSLYDITGNIADVNTLLINSGDLRDLRAKNKVLSADNEAMRKREQGYEFENDVLKKDVAYLKAENTTLQAAYAAARLEIESLRGRSVPVSEADMVLAAMETGEWELQRLLPQTCFTSDANIRHAWSVKRGAAPYCTEDGLRIWTGATPLEALRNGAAALGVELPGCSETAALPEPDTHCFDDDTQKSVWSYSEGLMRSILASDRAMRAAQPAGEYPLLPEPVGKVEVSTTPENSGLRRHKASPAYTTDQRRAYVDRAMRAAQPAAAQQTGAAYAALPDECDSPEICAISKTCAGQFGTKRICASHGQAPAQAAPAVREAVAKAIYDQWVYKDGWVAWVNGGNSLRQDDARRLADLAFAMAQAAPAAVAGPADTFRGDTTCLVQNIIALLELDAEGALVPHGIGGHARALLSAAASRLAAPTPQPAPRQGIGKVVHQFRKQHCAEWYDGHADHSDGRGPYEERTLYTPPSPASQGDALDAVAAEREACAQECLRQAGLTVPSYDTAVACATAIRARAAQEGKSHGAD